MRRLWSTMQWIYANSQHSGGGRIHPQPKPDQFGGETCQSLEAVNCHKLWCRECGFITKLAITWKIEWSLGVMKMRIKAKECPRIPEGRGRGRGRRRCFTCFCLLPQPGQHYHHHPMLSMEISSVGNLIILIEAYIVKGVNLYPMTMIKVLCRERKIIDLIRCRCKCNE